MYLFFQSFFKVCFIFHPVLFICGFDFLNAFYCFINLLISFDSYFISLLFEITRFLFYDNFDTRLVFKMCYKNESDQTYFCTHFASC